MGDFFLNNTTSTLELDKVQRFPRTELLQRFINNNETIVDTVEKQMTIMREEMEPCAISILTRGIFPLKTCRKDD